jgi:hypothetical protein
VRCIFLLLVLAGMTAHAETWQHATDGRFVVETASPADRENLGSVFATLQEAARELRQDWGLGLPKRVRVRIYPTLAAYTAATAQPWYVAATADRDAVTLHLQRLRVLSERGSLETTLRHELFHLVQPPDWPRWRAEGSAMRFAGERPDHAPFFGVGETELNRRLAEAGSREDLARAAATAWLWVTRPRIP